MRGSFLPEYFTVPPSGKKRAAADTLKAIHASEDLEAARKKAKDVSEKLREMKLNKAADIIERGAEEMFSYHEYPPEHW